MRDPYQRGSRFHQKRQPVGRGLWEPRPSPVGTALSQLTSQKEPDGRLSRSGRRPCSQRAGTHLARLSPPSSCSCRRGCGAWGLWGLRTELKPLYRHIWEYLWSRGFLPHSFWSTFPIFSLKIFSVQQSNARQFRQDQKIDVIDSEKTMSWSAEVWGDLTLGRLVIQEPF